MVSDSRVLPADIAPCAPEAADVIRRITHDLSGPLRSIRQIAFYLDVALPAADSRSRKRLLALQRQILQARWILDDAVLSLAAAPPHCTIVDMKEVVSQALLAWQAEDTAWLCVEYAGELPLVSVDVAQIEQLIRRLVLFFAADARRATRVRCRPSGSDVAIEFMPPGSVEIPPALLESVDGGPGARLAAARKIIDNHGARIEVDRDPDDQVTLRIVFPAAL